MDAAPWTENDLLTGTNRDLIGQNERGLASGFSLSILGVAAAFSILLHPATVKSFRHHPKLHRLIIGLLLAFLGYTIAYNIPDVHGGVNLRPVALNEQMSEKYGKLVAWSPACSIVMLFPIAFWMADAALGYFIAWKGNRISRALYGLGIISMIAADLTAPLSFSFVAILYDASAFCVLLARYLKSRNTNTQEHIHVPPPLGVVVGAGMLCIVRCIWTVALLEAGGSEVWEDEGLAGAGGWKSERRTAFQILSNFPGRVVYRAHYLESGVTEKVPNGP